MPAASPPLRIGVVGVGLVGAAHIEAVARTGMAEVVALAASSAESARLAAGRYRIPRAEGAWRAVVEDESIDVVHNCTPNHLHGEIGRAALAAGKHLVTEKPLAHTLHDARALVDDAGQSGRVTALCHNYRHYAMVAEARELIRSGAIGDIHHIHGTYLQGWLTGEEVGDWRLDSGLSGASTTFADIGTHWCDLAMHLGGRPITSVCASTGGLHGRHTDDHGGVLLRFEGGAIGTLVASQVSPGASNSLRIRFDGSEGSLSWDQERPEELWLRRVDRPAELRGKSALHESAAPLARLPPGHLEGWSTTFVNLFGSVYRRIIGQPLPGDDRVATLAEGLVLMCLIEAVVQSSRERSWVDLPPN